MLPTTSEVRPAGVTATALVAALLGLYLGGAGLVLLVWPASISIASGAPFLGGLEMTGPAIFLLVAALAAGVGIGLWCLQNWARYAAIALAGLGILLLVPVVSTGLIELDFARLGWGGLGVLLRAMMIWYLSQEAVRNAFLGAPDLSLR